MSEPLRLRDARSAARPEVRALLAAAEPSPPLPPRVRARVRRALAAQTDAGARERAYWPHVLGSALALATASVWLIVHPPEPRPAHLIALAPEQVAAEPRRPALEARPVSEPAPVAVAVAEPEPEPASEAAPRIARASTDSAAKSSARLRARWRDQRWQNDAERSRRRIEAVVDDILKPEAQLLERARHEVARDPEQSLALIEAYRKRYPEAQVPAPSVVVEVDALRRLGRFDEALARARAFVESSHKDYYADEMVDRFALLEL